MQKSLPGSGCIWNYGCDVCKENLLFQLTKRSLLALNNSKWNFQKQFQMEFSELLVTHRWTENRSRITEPAMAHSAISCTKSLSLDFVNQNTIHPCRIKKWMQYSGLFATHEFVQGILHKKWLQRCPTHHHSNHAQELLPWNFTIALYQPWHSIQHHQREIQSNHASQDNWS